MKLLAFGVIGCFAAPAMASNWVKAGGGSDGTQLAIDMASVSRNGESAKVWIELDYSKVAAERARRSKELWKFHCSDETSFTAAQILCRADGSVLNSNNPIETSYGYHAVAPDTLGAFVMGTVCRKTNAQN